MTSIAGGTMQTWRDQRYCVFASIHQRNSSRTTAGNASRRKSAEPMDERATWAARRAHPHVAGQAMPRGSPAVI
eukprot:CAMPEP_0170618624 /NCGR_PEP_ID=MMETSP0224-20130122/27057_1 /TAXON_ID=285029 /ORGANISM="Togula jolla, Strain CCCM 725" /LENGTH=73 /DNA_ID=CAMNT_0010944609 /DNA_START=174 /DNA_END=395 /DNA_ORIENTATION=-